MIWSLSSVVVGLGLVLGLSLWLWLWFASAGGSSALLWLVRSVVVGFESGIGL